MRKLVGFIFLLFCLASNIQAQIDTEFWFAAPDLYSGHGQQPIRFCISSFNDPATVVFEQPANSSYTPMTFELDANSFHVYDVSSIISIVETQPYNTVLNYGFHIYSTTPISVYYESDNCNSEIYSLKGTNALGTNFIVSSQFTFTNSYSKHSCVEVVATQDETEVTFIPSVTVKNGQPAGVPITIMLNKGQSYALEAEGGSGSDHIRNTRVVSNKPIAVNSSDDSVTCQSAVDLIGDQIVPVNLLGTDYCALWNNTSNEYLYFFPTQDNTNIYLDGDPTPIATLNVGEEFSYRLNTAVVYVHSDNPIAVFQLASDQGGELGGTVLPHINCTGSRKVVYRRNGTMDLIITVVVKSSCVDDFLLNNNSSWLTSSDFEVVPSNVEYSYCKKNVTQYVSDEGLITIENTNEDGYFQMGMLSRGGSSGTCSYGYFSDYRKYAYAEFNMNTTFCVGENITFGYDAENVDNLTLILPNGTTMTQPPFVLTNAQVSQSGIYQLQGESCNGVQILDEIYLSIENCIIPDVSFPDNIDTANCVFFPTSTEWGIEVGWSSESIVSNLNIPLVGDLDNDGHPEIICFSKSGQSSSAPNTDNQILVFDGVTKQLKTTITMSSPVTAYDAAAYGMVKLPSGKGLIVTACYDFKLRAYDITAADPNTPFWTSDVDYGSNYGDWGVNVSFADFNADGHPEVYVRNKIYSAETGALLVSTTGSGNTGSSYCHWTHSTNYKLSAPMAADVCNDAKLELILGNEIYKVNITNPYGSSGNTITLERQVTPPSGVPVDGNVQVADFNADGYLDVFISIRNTDTYSGNVYCYVWDVHNNAVSMPLTINTSWSGKSIPMISDIDNDGLMEVLIQSGVSNSNDKFQAYKYQTSTQSFNLIWGFATDEDSYSNSITSFDFNQDGLLELMICDQSTVRIVNGSGYSHITGNDTIPVYVMSSFPFSETTIMQYPIIVDVDDDGNAEIVSVGSDKLNIFESVGEPWAPARKVWNQYMYNVTNVNKDLTIPQYLFNNATPFTDPNGVVRRPFNNFLQQATTIDQYGRPFYAVADVAALSVDITTSGDNITFTVTYTNQGDNTLNAPYDITVFANQMGGVMMQSFTVDEPLLVGNTVQQSLSIPSSDLCQMPDLNSVVVVINCAGDGVAQDGNQQPECDITNNMAQVDVNLQSEPTTITKIACDQFIWNDITYTQSGEYQQIFANSYGCDSVVILILTISDTEIIELPSVAECETYEWHGQTYIESGIYTFDTLNPYGCQLQYVLPLTINYSTESELSETSCEPYEWYGTVYDESGTYTHLLTGSNGCDSLVSLNLVVSTASEGSIHGPTSVYLTTNLVSGVYPYYLDSTDVNPSNVHWSIDKEDWQLIPHGASCDLICLSEGEGILRVWTEGELCNMDTTLVVNATFFDVGEEASLLKLYPNPTQGKVTVEWEGIRGINVYDLLGQKLLGYEYGEERVCELDLGRLQQGVYVLEIVSSEGRVIRPVVLTR